MHYIVADSTLMAGFHSLRPQFIKHRKTSDSISLNMTFLVFGIMFESQICQINIGRSVVEVEQLVELEQ
jgi:hypothetical protein